MNIYKQWIDAKAAEKQAQEARREIEDLIINEMGISTQSDGNQSFEVGEYKIKTTCRMNRRIDVDALQEIAAENGLAEHLGKLFRWKPEINAKAWRDASSDITEPLLNAITTKPGRPSFSIELKTNEQEK